MPTGTQSRPKGDAEPEPVPEVSVCETCPGTSIFIESGNTDGWISSDLTTNITR